MARPVHSEEQVQDTRRRLTELALALYREQGYDAVTLRELGARAGMSHATPYRYFSSKDELFMQVRALVYERFADFLAACDPHRGDPLSRLRRVVLGMVEFSERWPEDYRLIFSMRQPTPPPDSALALARQRALVQASAVCQEAIDAGQLDGDANTQMHLAWGALHGLLSLHVSNHLVHGRRLHDLVLPMIDRLFGGATAGVEAETRRELESPA